MDRVKLNYWIDYGLFLSFIICFVTGLIKWPDLIEIIGVEAYTILHIENMNTLHDWSDLAIGVLSIIHVGLHWKWIITTTKKMFTE